AAAPQSAAGLSGAAEPRAAGRARFFPGAGDAGTWQRQARFEARPRPGAGTRARQWAVTVVSGEWWRAQPRGMACGIQTTGGSILTTHHSPLTTHHSPLTMSLDNCRVVLVRPQVAGNLGATARVMHNMGLSRLILVAPEADPADGQARQLSTHGEFILDQ